MGYLNTGWKGIPLKEIINKFGDHDYECIECRCKYINHEGIEEDILFGYCSYINGKIIPLDGDSYSLNDLYIEYEEWLDSDSQPILTVWEYGELEDF